MPPSHRSREKAQALGAYERAPSEALRQIARFWRLVFERTTAARLFAMSGLILIAGLSEGSTLILLIPLLQSLDSVNGAPSSSRLYNIFESLGLRPTLTGVLAVFLVFVTARSIIVRLRDLTLNTLRLQLIRDIRVRLYSAIAHASWSFLRQNRRADYLTALTAETDRLDQAVYFALEIPARAMIIGAHIVAACLIAPILSLAALASGLLIAFLVRGRLVESLRLGERLSASSKELYHEISEFLGGLKVTKSYAAEDRYVTIFARAIDDVKGNLLSYTKSHLNARLFQDVAGAFAVAFFLWVSTGLLGLPVAEVLVLALIFYRLLPLVQGLHQSAQRILHTSAAVQTLLDLLERCEAAEERPHAQATPMSGLRVAIRIENVSFRHDCNGPQTLSNVNLNLQANSLTVLSGSSGSGKSTLLDLLAGLLRPDQGKIFVDDRELTGMLVPAWRRSVSYVTQAPFLFHDTIRANLLVASPTASENDVCEALHSSGAAMFVKSLPEGLDTIVGDRGSRFSGGEQQRLALARALLRRPALLILDEPTSSLDEQSEQLVLAEIEALRGSMTMIMVTHRPERARSADQILRLEGGQLREPFSGQGIDQHLSDRQKLVR
jgi:ATP-binding cassette, subfamily C, bacterial